MKKTMLLMITLLAGACTTRGILAPLPHEAIGDNRYSVRCPYGVADADCGHAHLLQVYCDPDGSKIQLAARPCRR